MRKKVLALLLCAMMVISVFALGACGDDNAQQDPGQTDGQGEGQTEGDGAEGEGQTAGIPKEDIKVGFIYIGDIKDGGYNEGHDKGRLALEAEGIACEYKENVPESTAEVETAISELIDLGCNVIYATSFGHMEGTLNMANAHPDVYFGHATGYMTAENMCTYMGKIYQPRYLTGIVAGMKTETNKIGYVMAMPFAECIRGMNAFTRGVRSVNPDATVEFMLVNSWTDVAAAKQCAVELLNKGCDVIAQHHDSTTVQLAAQEAGAYCVGYNVATPDVAPEAYMTAAIFNWANFYTQNVQAIIDGTWKGEAYWEGMDKGWVDIDALTALAPEGAAEKVEEVKAQIIDGTFDPFQGEVKDQNGEVKATDMTPDEIWNMEWLVEGVVGSLS